MLVSCSEHAQCLSLVLSMLSDGYVYIAVVGGTIHFGT